MLETILLSQTTDVALSIWSYIYIYGFSAWVFRLLAWVRVRWEVCSFAAGEGEWPFLFFWPLFELDLRCYARNLVTRPFQSCSPSISVSAAATFGRVGPPRSERGLHALRMRSECEGHAPFFFGLVVGAFGMAGVQQQRGVPGAACVSHAPTPGCCLLCAGSELVFLLLFFTVYLCNFQTIWGPVWWLGY
jgi:hypothetical protein